MSTKKRSEEYRKGWNDCIDGLIKQAEVLQQQGAVGTSLVSLIREANKSRLKD